MATNSNSNLKCPKCGSTSVYYGGIDPVHCSAVCRHCGLQIIGMEKVSRYFGGQASYAAYVAEKEAEEAAQKQAIRDNEEACKRIAAQKAACHHEWQYNIMDNVGVRFCPKCGALEQA